MKVQMSMVTALLLMLLASVLALSEALGSQASASERQPGAGGHGEDPWLPGHGGNNLAGQSLKGSHPLVSAQEVMGETSPGSRSASKAMAKLPLSTGKQDSPRKPRRLPPQLSRSRSPRLGHHLKGHGKFNGDTHSCHSIQSRPCRKPSDCGGCLGLYTCKLPAGTCDLKGISRQRGGFLQSIQSPERRRVLLIP